MSAGPLVVTYPLTGRSRAIVAEELSGAAEAIYLVDLAPADRSGVPGRCCPTTRRRNCGQTPISLGSPDLR
jgi:hypothetical protein